jgi:hypothetical protein
MNEERVLLLLQICDYANQWAPLRALHDVAMMELVELAQDAKEELTRRAEAAARAKADAQARADAKAQAAVQPKPAPAPVVVAPPPAPTPAPATPPPTPPIPDGERRV